jgi:hypothetical protein
VRPWLAAVALGLAVPAGARAGPATTSCIACHGNRALVGEDGTRVVARFATGVHAAVGLSCHDCHGGNPDPALAGDMAAAMDPGFGPHPFVGAPSRAGIPAFCGGCHSEPAFMKRYKPDARVDQEREYWTSRHGELLRQGDLRVATCVDCHGTHGILAPTDAESRVHPKNVATTCAGCHADAAHMAGYALPDGRPLPIDQYARWRQSVHASALLEREDLSAPTCNDCHGNHGATPPGVESVAFVCGQCHGREADLFRASPKRAGFETHRALLSAAGADGCRACHSPSEPPGQLGPEASLTECVACHGSHGVVRPTVAMLAPLPATPCQFCHAYPESSASAVASPEGERRRFEQVRDGLLAMADAQGLRDAVRFDWLVDRALELPTHTVAQPGGAPRLRDEFRRLFTKFRIGKTYYTYPDPVTGRPVRAGIVRCSDCHATAATTDVGPGARTSAVYVAHMEKLTTRVAQAERMLLAARRGGVETRRVGPEIDQAVNAQIELEVLVHGFTTAPGSEFLKTFDAGMAHARTAITGAHRAVDELGFRRRGLVVFLGFLILVLIALGLKIRQLSRDERHGG